MINKGTEAETGVANIKRETHFVNKMILSNMINVVIIAMVCGLFYINAIYSIKQETLKYTARIIFQISISLDTIVENLQEMAWRVLSNDDVIRILKVNSKESTYSANNLSLGGEEEIALEQQTMSKILYNAAGYSNNIEAFTVFSLNGATYDVGNKSTKLGYNFRSEPWYHEIQKENSVILNTHLQTHVVEGTAVKVISLVKRINDPQNMKLLGYILIDLNANVYNQILNKTNMIPNSDIIVADNKGNVTYGSSIMKKMNHQEINNLLAQANARSQGDFEGYYENQDMFVSYCTSMKTGWKIIHVTPAAEASKNLIYIKRLTLVLTIVSLLLAVILSVIMSKKVTKPLNLLTSGIKQLEKGDLSAVVDIRSNDEIGTVGESFNKMVAELKNLIDRVYKAEIVKKEASLQALQAQINPHFLYNTLAMIDGIASVNGQNDIKTIVQALGKIFRYSISGCEVTTIGEEMNYVKMYLDIQKIRFYRVLESTIDFDASIKDCQIPKLIIQPLIENAFVHGFDSATAKAAIKISARKTGDDILITVADNGSGIPKEKLDAIISDISGDPDSRTTVQNIGLRNVNDRIKNLYGEAYKLLITSEEGAGTTSGIVIPFRTGRV